MKPLMVAAETRVVPGETVRVHSIGRVEARLDLGLGTLVMRHLLVEGVNRIEIPPDLRSAAMHVLVTLVGGKRILAHVDITNTDGHIPARLFLDDPTVTPHDEYLEVPYGMQSKRLDVCSFLLWMRPRKFDVAVVRAILNGKPV